MSESTGHVLRRAFRIAPALSKGLGVTLALAVFGTGLQLVVPITVQRIAPLGDPMEIRFRGFSLALRPSEADSLELDPT